jgi:hypothetical protein
VFLAVEPGANVLVAVGLPIALAHGQSALAML